MDAECQNRPRAIRPIITALTNSFRHTGRMGGSMWLVLVLGVLAVAELSELDKRKIELDRCQKKRAQCVKLGGQRCTVCEDEERRVREWSDGGEVLSEKEEAEEKPKEPKVTPHCPPCSCKNEPPQTDCKTAKDDCPYLRKSYEKMKMDLERANSSCGGTTDILLVYYGVTGLSAMAFACLLLPFLQRDPADIPSVLQYKIEKLEDLIVSVSYELWKAFMLHWITVFVGIAMMAGVTYATYRGAYDASGTGINYYTKMLLGDVVGHTYVFMYSLITIPVGLFGLRMSFIGLGNMLSPNKLTQAYREGRLAVSRARSHRNTSPAEIDRESDFLGAAYAKLENVFDKTSNQTIKVELPSDHHPAEQKAVEARNPKTLAIEEKELKCDE
eukprot:TRINITY_DN13160_c0_g1_i1.p1 TRINITY_DN13160_c0_g1~~TRINITY_DN13160_c0_g1_i1.p1  ORF type:complete len:386 (+),score=65.82 TRINITY_DN13160_c0_g1_i1:247-1404(+)